jgi:hypothetical protein
MGFDKRIWKTAVLAVVITLVGWLVVMRLDDWSRGLNSQIIVYGQSGTGAGGTGGTGHTSIVKALAHVVGGQGYASIVEIVNTGSVAANISASFFNRDGKASTASYTLNQNGTTATFIGSMPSPVSVPSNGILVITLPNTASAMVANWGTITSTSTMSIAEVFELRDPNNILLSRVGVPASDPDMKQFVIPRFRNVGTGLEVGFAIANTSTTPTIVTVVVRDASGQTVSNGTQTLTLRGRSQVAENVNQLFTALNDPATTTGYYSLTFTGGSSQLAAVGLVLEGTNLATFPVDRIQ